MNLTNNEIIKALECCVRSTSGNDCEDLCCPACKEFGCHYMDISDRDDSYEALIEGLGKAVLDLINRQKATIKEFDEKIVMQMGLIEYQKSEIERWRAKCNLPKEGFFNVLCGALVYTKTLEEYNQFRRTIKVEAIKEFAERLKGSAFDCDVSLGYRNGCYVKAVTTIEIDNLVKEMTNK